MATSRVVTGVVIAGVGVAAAVGVALAMRGKGKARCCGCEGSCVSAVEVGNAFSLIFAEAQKRGNFEGIQFSPVNIASILNGEVPDNFVGAGHWVNLFGEEGLRGLVFEANGIKAPNVNPGAGACLPAGCRWWLLEPPGNEETEGVAYATRLRELYPRHPLSRTELPWL